MPPMSVTIIVELNVFLLLSSMSFCKAWICFNVTSSLNLTFRRWTPSLFSARICKDGHQNAQLAKQQWRANYPWRKLDLRGLTSKWRLWAKRQLGAFRVSPTSIFCKIQEMISKARIAQEKDNSRSKDLLIWGCNVLSICSRQDVFVEL